MNEIDLFGMKFSHRRPTAHEYVFRDFACFGAFAALCRARGIAHYVHSVFFDHNFMGFKVDIAQEHENTTVHRELWACAEATLPQFEMFGYVGHQGGDSWDM